ncbi:uncharacterized protein F4807DRAFT_172351 [Annulohypoxylon truncatum]|uniref:uncharacterized protein n=1 Tax=Annulohypoxylon truncatum TaxID=327061 RepID=UPI002008ACFD|nr:uncharacterized protein F4807DRAFT_172351 [Annulohypoxylon truncatum]KAI1207609.1 hypothetical protein F4807DRAFT_172351 [Annulohypoxylon truncatum]
MHFSHTFQFVAMTASIFFQSSSGWSFTMFNDAGCGNSTSTTGADKVEQPGDVTCDSVPNADRHKSILGGIPSGSECRISLYSSAGCGDREAFSLTQYTTTCFSLEDFTAPLAFYEATGCA